MPKAQLLDLLCEKGKQPGGPITGISKINEQRPLVLERKSFQFRFCNTTVQQPCMQVLGVQSGVHLYFKSVAIVHRVSFFMRSPSN